MKKATFFHVRTALLLGALLLVGAVSFGTIPIDGILNLFSNPTGVITAVAAAGVSVVGDSASTGQAATKSPDLLLPSISKKISLVKPDDFPLDTILRTISPAGSAVGSWEPKWYTGELRGIEDTITTGNATATAAGVTKAVTVTNKHIWTVGDLAMIPSMTGAADGKELVLQVVARNYAAGTITLFGLNTTGNNVPVIANNTDIKRMGNAMSDKDYTVESYEIYPANASNYMQIHMNKVSQNLYEKLHTEKEVDWGMEDYRLQALYDLRRGMEAVSLFGYKAKLTDPVSGTKERHYSAGITRFITKTQTWDTSAGITDEDMVKLAQLCFVGNNGAKRRPMLVGSNLMKALHSISAIQKQLDAKSWEVNWGVKFKEYGTNFGDFLIRHHQLLDYYGYSNNAIILDPANIERFVMKPMETRLIDGRKTNQSNDTEAIIDETFCLGVKLPDTHCIFKGV